MAGAADEVLEDLRDEGDALDALVAPLPPERWAEPTPAPGWSVAHQIAHLAWTDAQALRAAREPEEFRRGTEELLADPAAAATLVDDGARAGAAEPPAGLLARWRDGRGALARALAGTPHGQRLPWYGPPMSAAGMATARLMETWAHGEDVADALGVHREATARLRHVAWLGVRTRDFAHVVHGLEPPAAPFRVELTVPAAVRRAHTDGPGTWAYGPEDAPQRVTGPALDFCLLVTQRLHRDDTALHADGPDAERWLGIAQAFAGPPGGGRKPGARTPASPGDGDDHSTGGDGIGAGR